MFEGQPAVCDATNFTSPAGEAAAGSERIGIVGAQHSLLVCEEQSVIVTCSSGVASLASPVGESAALGEDFRTVRTEYPQLVLN